MLCPSAYHTINFHVRISSFYNQIINIFVFIFTNTMNEKKRKFLCEYCSCLSSFTPKCSQLLWRAETCPHNDLMASCSCYFFASWSWNVFSDEVNCICQVFKFPIAFNLIFIVRVCKSKISLSLVSHFFEQLYKIFFVSSTEQLPWFSSLTFFWIALTFFLWLITKICFLSRKIFRCMHNIIQKSTFSLVIVFVTFSLTSSLLRSITLI